MGRPYQGGYITSKGYLRTHRTKDGRLRMVHDLIWEDNHGPIPEGMDVHHINGNKQDNAIENLRLLDRLTHKRLHGGCELKNGMWWKPCRQCGVMKCVNTDYYRINKGKWIQSICKTCQISCSVKSKIKRRLARVAVLKIV